MSVTTLPAPPSTPPASRHPIGIHRPGTVIAQSYRMGRVIGAGGMGVVYSGMQLATGRDVAVKVLRSEHSPNTAVKVRFLREGRLLGMLRGPHLPRLLDVGELEDGTLYLVLELLAGPSLRVLLDDGAVETQHAVNLLLQVCHAAAEAHDRGIVHRDIKPENVVFVSHYADGLAGAVVKLVDFGIAKDPQSTPTGGCSHYYLGSPEYMAPEQRLAPETVDASADVWSLGVLLYELLCADLPPSVDLGGGSGRVLRMPPGVPQGLEDVVAKCLEPRPADRFQNARELGRALLPFGWAAQCVGLGPIQGGESTPQQGRQAPEHSGVFRVVGPECDTLVEAGIDERARTAPAANKRD